MYVILCSSGVCVRRCVCKEVCVGSVCDTM